MRAWTLAGMALLAVVAAPAAALTVQTRADLDGTLAATRFTGVGSLGYVWSGGVSLSCTASLIGASVGITAAHCIDPNPDYRFVLPAAGDASRSGTFDQFAVDSWAIVPNYATGKDTDLALFRFNGVATGHDIYDIFTGNTELGSTITVVGAGMTGTLDTGARWSDTDLRLRYGYNRYDIDGRQFANGYADHLGYARTDPSDEDILLMDYDSGLAVNDVFGRYLGVVDTGVVIDGVLREVGMIYGDSGGPDFIDGKIAGIHSFLFSGNIFEDGQSCGQPGNVDGGQSDDEFRCYDGSWGDVGGSVRVSYYQDFIRGFLGVVPEPSTWIMMIGGFALIAGQLRRRRPVFATAPVSTR